MRGELSLLLKLKNAIARPPPRPRTARMRHAHPDELPLIPAARGAGRVLATERRFVFSRKTMWFHL
jgi:hypothetical protein